MNIAILCANHQERIRTLSEPSTTYRFEEVIERGNYSIITKQNNYYLVVQPEQLLRLHIQDWHLSSQAVFRHDLEEFIKMAISRIRKL